MFLMSVIPLFWGEFEGVPLCMSATSFCVLRSKPQNEACASVVSDKLHCSPWLFLFVCLFSLVAALIPWEFCLYSIKNEHNI